MKNIVIAVSFFLAMALQVSNGYAAGNLERDNYMRTPIQGAAWNGAKAVALSVASTTVDFSSDVAYRVYSTVDCYERWMPLSTSTKASYVQTPILAGTWDGAVINAATPFGNFSGCTGGFLRKQ